MPSLEDASTYTAELLAQTCASRQGDGSHEPYCTELFRRAILRLADGDACWVKILDAYSGQVKAWVRKRLFGVSQEELDDLVHDSFARFNRYYTADKLQAANHGIGSVMAFLRSCANSVAIDEIR